VVAKAYTRISTGRLGALLGLDAPTTEAALAELVSDKALWAKIDRPAGVVAFSPPQPAAEVLRSWAGDIDAVLAQLETATHLINKEAMVRGVTLVPQPVSAAAATSTAARLQL
jgi:26S proteasome regulatory subunit N5